MFVSHVAIILENADYGKMMPVPCKWRLRGTQKFMFVLVKEMSKTACSGWCVKMFSLNIYITDLTSI